MKIKGKAAYVDTAGVRHEVKGLGSLSDDTALHSLKVSGTFEFGKISCDKIDVSGKCEGGSVQAESFSLKGKPEIDSIKADETVIESQTGSIGEIECKRLKVFNRMSAGGKALLEKLFGGHDSEFDFNSRVRVKNISADKVELENCEVDVIKCRDAFIGANCAIEKLFVSGECQVATDSTVRETIRG